MRGASERDSTEAMMGAIPDGSYKSMWSDLQATVDAVNRREAEDAAKPKRCDGCRYWQSDDAQWGRCRRHAPVLSSNAANDGCVPFFPVTREHHWCGDHEAVPVAVAVAERMPGDPAYVAFDSWVGTPGARMCLRDAFYAGRASVKP